MNNSCFPKWPCYFNTPFQRPPPLSEPRLLSREFPTRPTQWEQGWCCLRWVSLSSFTKPLEWFLLQAHYPHPDSTYPSSLWCNRLTNLRHEDSSSIYTVNSNFCQNLSPIQNSQAENKSLCWTGLKINPLLCFTHKSKPTRKKEREKVWGLQKKW